MAMSPCKLTLHSYSDALSGLIICAEIIFSPWAFGTTDHWSIWTMNIFGLLLGLLLGIKLLIRASTRYQFPRWDDFGEDEEGFFKGQRFRITRIALAIFSGLIVLYCLIHAWNSKCTVDMTTFTLSERPCISWLPHSFDGPSCWEAFWRYLALTLSFWAIHDWLMGKSTKDARHCRHPSPQEHALVEQTSDLPVPGVSNSVVNSPLPSRLSLLLWVLCINGALLGLEAIIQRACASNYLLFLRLPPEQPTVEAQFGPYAYRSNACQYFNLVWPVCVGFWWTLRRGRRQSNPGMGVILRPAVLISAAIMALCTLITASRLGAFTGAVSILAAAIVIWTGTRSGDNKLKWGIAGTVLLVFGLGFLMGWDRLAGRLSEFNIDEGFANRNIMYELADQMAVDNPVWGTGPGTFANLYFLYRKDPGEDWFAQLHNDWLETQITFGWVGCGLLAIAFAILLSRWFATGRIGGGRRLPLLLLIAMAGAFLEARWDFPFQIYSTLFAFMIACSVFFALSRHRYR